MKLGAFAVGVFACILLGPIAASAQSAIAGVVTDTTGAVLPGVTVEASSPALIEQTRSVVTDASGVFRIVTCVPGLIKSRSPYRGSARWCAKASRSSRNSRQP